MRVFTHTHAHISTHIHSLIAVACVLAHEHVHAPKDIPFNKSACVQTLEVKLREAVKGDENTPALPDQVCSLTCKCVFMYVYACVGVLEYKSDQVCSITLYL